MTPHPTPTRVAFARDIEAGRIRWYNFVEPVAHHTVTARKVTSALVEFVHANLAQVPQCDEGLSSIAELTVDGRAWLLSVTDREGEGPAVTSPAAGPPAESDEWPGEPCQPIGCDNGYHLPGCQFIETDKDGNE